MPDVFVDVGTVPASQTTFDNTGLTPATSYTYRVLASNSAGDSPPSNQATAATTSGTPPAPTNLVATTSTTSPTSAIVVTWNAVTGAATYKLQHSTSPSGGFAVIATGLTQRTFTHTGLAASSTHYYRAIATNSFGDSPVSNVDSATTANAPAPDPGGGGGTANCTNANVKINSGEDVRARINGAPAGSLICIAAGTFNTSGSITPKSGCRIVGAGYTTSSDGHGTNMKINPTTTINWTGGIGSIFDLAPSSNITFENLHITGAKLNKDINRQSGRGLSEGTGTITARHCKFSFNETASCNGQKDKLVLEDCEIDRCGSDQGLGFAAGGVKCVNSATLTRVYIHDCIGNGFWSDCGNPGPWTIQDSLVVGCRRKGVHWELSGGDNKTTFAGFVLRSRFFNNNTEGQNDGGGIVANISKNYLVEGNTCRGNGKASIRIKYGGLRPVGQSCHTGYQPSNIVVRNNNVDTPVVGCEYATCSNNT